MLSQKATLFNQSTSPTPLDVAAVLDAKRSAIGAHFIWDSEHGRRGYASHSVQAMLVAAGDERDPIEFWADVQ
jgi:hypothetical protein